jgi:cell wall-associated NlpC family hydrolase
VRSLFPIEASAKSALAMALLAAGVAALASAVVAAAGAAGAQASPQALPWGMSCRPAVAGTPRTSATCGATLVDGRAIAPPGAPELVKETIAAANRIDGRPYVWGGGHLSWTTHGYDCSGAVGYALHGAGLLSETMVSGQLEHWGEGGVGRWITIYANYHHVYMVIAGLRYDTRDDPPGVSGPRWHTEVAPPGEFAARHPAGL